jgi:hypothetical protein
MLNLDERKAWCDKLLAQAQRHLLEPGDTAQQLASCAVAITPAPSRAGVAGQYFTMQNGVSAWFGGDDLEQGLHVLTALEDEATFALAEFVQHPPDVAAARAHSIVREVCKAD